MQTLRSSKNMIFFAIIIFILGIQLFYIMNIRTQLVREVLDIQSQSQLKQAELITQERQLKRLPQIKKELEQVNAEKNGVIEIIPTQISVVREFIELVRLMEANGFREIKIQQVEQIVHEEEKTSIIESRYRVTYTSTYTESKNFISNLNNSYQLINISSLNMDNAPQTAGENLNDYGDQLKQVISSTIEFTLFAVEGQSQEEIYTPHATISNNTYNPFGKRSNITPQDVEPSSNQLSEPSDLSITKADAFNLNIWDELVSGDNYTFASPGPVDRLYTGLSSGDNVYVTLTLREDGYDVVMEDDVGRISQNSALLTLSDPSLHIDSSMKKIKEDMPHIKIYIKNYTTSEINVSLTGSLLENIFIYNEYDEPVLPGQTKGSVKLTSF